MPTPSLTDEIAIEAAEMVQRFGSQNKAAAELGITRSTLQNRLRIAAARRLDGSAIESEPELPAFPEEDIPIEQVIDLQCRRVEKRIASYDAHTWFQIKIPDNRPVGLFWFGDPHIDDNGCNWPVLRSHIELCRATDGLYGANIGDTTNNWAGRLVRLYANQDTSAKTARRLAEWFMLDSGVKWLIWILGNHDAWGDGSAILAQMAKRHGTQKLVCHDWEARFSLGFPNGWESRIFASHDFKGHSQWNPLHGPMKEGQMGEDADLYVCGHKHNAAHFGFENVARSRYQQFVRLRGYKFLDEYAKRGGFPQQEGGCGAITIHDPITQTVTVHFDVDEGADLLKFKRRKAA